MTFGWRGGRCRTRFVGPAISRSDDLGVIRWSDSSGNELLKVKSCLDFLLPDYFIVDGHSSLARPPPERGMAKRGPKVRVGNPHELFASRGNLDIELRKAKYHVTSIP